MITCISEATKRKWTGFSAQCMCAISTVSPSRRIPWNILSMGLSGGFDAKTGVFTAPVDGLYFVVFVHTQLGSNPTTIRLMLSTQAGWREQSMITTRTTELSTYDFGQRHILMSAGETFYLSLPKKSCRYRVPFFSCVLVD